MKQLLDNANVRAAFRMSLVLKGAIALAEVAAGSLAYLVTPQFRTQPGADHYADGIDGGAA